MKITRKLLSFLLVFALTFSLTNVFMAKAADNVTVTLRIEQDDSTLLSPVTITLTEEDKNNDFGIGLSTGEDAALSPLRAYAKYLSTEKKVAKEDMSKYIIASPSSYGGLYVSGISLSGDRKGSATNDETKSDVYWMYYVNNISGDVSMSEYNLKDSDSVVICGMWSPYPAEEDILYAEFKTSETINQDKSVIIDLELVGHGVKYDENYNATSYTVPVSGATIIAANAATTVETGVTEKNAEYTSVTDANGKATLTVKNENDAEYVISAFKKSKDNKHYVISRPYLSVAVVTKDQNSGTNNTPSVKKPAKVKSVKAIAKKTGKNKKNIKLSWKKVSGANGYQIYISTKKASGFKKVADSAKTTYNLKKKKGTYYVKICAYKKADKKKITGSFSKTLKVIAK